MTIEFLAAPRTGRFVAPAVFVRRLATNRLGFVGGIVVLAVALAALLAPVLAPYDPTAQDTANRFLPPLSPEHFLGTDEFGRDVLSRLLFGARASLTIAAAAVVVSAVFGGGTGLVLGFVGGRVDFIAMRFVDAFSAIPTLMIGLGIVGLLGPGYETVIAALGVAYSPSFARITRSAAVSVRVQAFVEAARVMGASRGRIIGEDVVPMVLPIVVVQITSLMAWAILDEAALGFLGLGVQAPDASWGSMLTTGRTYFYSAPTLPLVAGLAVMVVVLGLNLLGDAMRDVLDPRAWQRGE